MGFARRMGIACVLAVVVLVVGGAGMRAELAQSDSFRDLFPVMPWELQAEKQALLLERGHGIESMRACGFDTVAFVRPDQLGSVEKAGMRALVGRPGDARVSWRTLSDRAVREYVKRVVDASGGSDALIGFFLADEPAVPDFPALAKAVAAVRELAPGKLAYVNLYPNTASAAQLGAKTYGEYLARFARVVKPQVLSYGNFGVQYSNDLRNSARAGSYLTNLVQVRRVALRQGLPFWTAIASNQIRPHTPVPSPANLAVQAYASLATGSRGLSWFTYYAGRYGYAPIDAAGRRTATWSYLAMVNAQVRALRPILAGLRSTGVYFTASPMTAGLSLLPGKAVTSVGVRSPVMVGEFVSSRNERYAMVVNLDLTRSVKLAVKARASRPSRVSPVDRSPEPLPSDGSLWLPAGQGALLEL
jgi:hypothetical protein